MVEEPLDGIHPWLDRILLSGRYENIFSKERRNGIIDAYGVISGNIGNESVLVSRTS